MAETNIPIGCERIFMVKKKSEFRSENKGEKNKTTRKVKPVLIN